MQVGGITGVVHRAFIRHTGGGHLGCLASVHVGSLLPGERSPGTPSKGIELNLRSRTRALALSTAFVGTLAPRALAVAGSLELAVDRANDPHISLDVRLAPTSAIFDAIEWAALPAGPIDLAAHAALTTVLATALGDVELAVSVHRN